MTEFDATILGAAVVAAVASVFFFTWVRDVMSKWSRKSELDAINHAHAVSTLGEVATQGQQGTNILPDASAFQPTPPQSPPK